MEPTQLEGLIETLKSRFTQNMRRHADADWHEVLARLRRQPDGAKALFEMEETRGEPDVVGQADANGAFLFCDCAPESPLARRSLCYDDEALMARKENKPVASAMGRAAAMGASLLTEAQYELLQRHGEFDLKTSSWLATPPGLRKLGGALFGDRRYGRVFVYHNGAQSYYAGRGFRCMLLV